MNKIKELRGYLDAQSQVWGIARPQPTSCSARRAGDDVEKRPKRHGFPML
jgi:hypothetical protein